MGRGGGVGCGGGGSWWRVLHREQSLVKGVAVFVDDGQGSGSSGCCLIGLKERILLRRFASRYSRKP